MDKKCVEMQANQSIIYILLHFKLNVIKGNLTFCDLQFKHIIMFTRLCPD